jgi:hypothetical protein
MSDRLIHGVAVAVALMAAMPFALSQVAGQAQGTAGRRAGASTFTPPRTPWGHPDLQGIYSNDDETGTPMTRPAHFAGRTLDSITPEEMATEVKRRNDQFNAGVSGTEFAGGLRPPAHLIFDTFDRKNKRAWLIVDPPDGQMPARVAGATSGAGGRGGRRGGVSTNANPNGPFNSWLDMGLYDRCITRGIPASMMPAGYGSRYDLTQSPDAVVIRYEMIHEARVIPLGLAASAARGPRKYLGDARGWWEGDTLVVETTNFRPEAAPQGASEHVVMTERFTPTSRDILEWRVTFADPTVWTRSWTFEMPLTKVDHTQQIHEYACHEGNLAMRNILSAARASETAESATSPR